MDHRFVVDWEEVFVRYFCKGIEAGARAAYEDNAFHFLPPVDYFFSCVDGFEIFKWCSLGVVGWSWMLKYIN